LEGVFVFDDHPHIVDNLGIRQWPPQGILSGGGGSRPLVTLTLAANYALGGLDTAGYHLLNTGVHLIAGLALYSIVRRTLRLPLFAARYDRSAEYLALTIALIWLVHPLQTQAVTYIIQRGESMMGMFFLLTLNAFILGSTSTSSWNRLWYGTAFITYCLGLISKEVMVTCLPAMCLYDRVFLTSSWRESLGRRGWLYLLFALPLLVGSFYVFPRLFGPSETTAGFSMSGITPWQYACSQPRVILHYLGLTLCPYPQCLDYGWAVETRWLSGIVIPVLALGGILGLSLWSLWRGWPIGFLGLVFFLILAPTSSIMPIQDLCVEHRMYLPLACVATALILIGYQLLQRPATQNLRLVGVTIVAVAVIGLGSLTVARNRVYHSASAMWSDVLYYPINNRQPTVVARAANNLADDLIKGGCVEEAVAILRKAIKITPESAEVHANLGGGLMQLEKFDESRRHLLEAVRLKPEIGRFRQQLGLLSATEGKPKQAEEHFRKAAGLSPGDAVIWFNLGQCLADQQAFEEAVSCFERALQLDSKLTIVKQRLAATHLDAGNQHRRQGEWNAASVCYRQAIQTLRVFPEAENNLGALLIADNPQQAAVHFRRAIAQRPDFYEARFNLAVTLTQLGQREEAAEQYRAVLQSKPDLLQARRNLHKLLAEDRGVE
jgi:tetratricopeptide (TPR) repeat protein